MAIPHSTPRWRTPLLGLVGLALGCTPAIDITPLGGPYPERPPDAPILEYSTRLPECPYVEVALLAAFEADLGSLESTLRALEGRTRSLGGDAIVHLARVEQGGPARRPGYTGTAIRFTEPDCRR